MSAVDGCNKISLLSNAGEMELMENSGLNIEALLDAQKTYWKSISSGSDVQSPEEWAEFIAKNQKKVHQEAPQQFSQLLDILGAQSSNFTQYGEQLLKQYKEGGEQHLNEAVLHFQQYMQQQTSDALMQQWQFPEQFAALFKTHSFQDDLLFDNPFISGMKSLLETPVIGTQRETQEQLREAIKLTMEYQEALQDYVKHYSSINKSASNQMLKTLTNGDKKISSLQQLHDIWVDAYESAYTKTILTDVYQRAHGRISNALMRLKKFVQDVRDIHFQSVGLATHKGLDTALQRQHKLRKEMRANRRDFAQLQQQVDKLQTDSTTAMLVELKNEVAALKKELATLKKAVKG
ncbi:poly(R)-hydroxyalkanoic acid synthase subunit PhaE [Neptuniibacter sp. 2_MG-2023]|jgi:class III poly(R)-hydroxyalkanoic acid synthase PhaE subunit|uniref:poly(R)-hydroxyalkanoic acid synthase subunit PhaE n=1 Tax=Neptuniibacter sp. 2_MG-2023 TaxID=3062671 RepID=UPI0026E373FC|nr:poly(R)-hydroxyalkanoic acid synthase subunit PhaE [Neptuniibacter sp. 2_MG-2023]MDO6513208.1 poly(R)-hydroxyalkanoic acid synthase subunit PhaE [Neptuniibacter sp. 2_MG-2023]